MNDLRNSHFYCPITEELMRDPVIDPEGHSYEREAITSWLAHNDTSPMTRTKLSVEQLIPNRSLQKAIEDELMVQATSISLEKSNTCSINDNVTVEDSLSVHFKEGNESTTIDIVATVTPPEYTGTEMIASDICCVVDVSGSMDGDASIIGVENSGLTLLDITKHALKTIITSLKENDRISIVSYSNSAKVVCGLTHMNAAGKHHALSLVDTLSADGMTNLWDGLKKGLDTLTEASSASSRTRNAALFLLTDGEPNVEPPRGHIPMLKRYREKHKGKFPGIISTFGFGYNVRSALLHDIAVVGGGIYAFIPDAGFVGTAFVNALGNVLSTRGTQLRMSMQFPDNMSTSVKVRVLGQQVVEESPTRILVDLGSLKFGQKKDVVFRCTDPDGISIDNLHAIERCIASVSYFPLSRKEPVTLTSGTLPSAESENSYMSAQVFRSELIITLDELLAERLKSSFDAVCSKGLTSLISRMQLWLRNHSKESEMYDLIEGLQKDLSGQVMEAIEEQYFKKWGKHYIPSLIRAHQLQECLNFKDPGVQAYGGSMFQYERDLADDAFNTLPAPTPALTTKAKMSSSRGITGQSKSLGKSSISYSSPVCMSRFNSASAPCFHESCQVKMYDGTVKAVAEIRRGDLVLCNTHTQQLSYAKVNCVLQTDTSQGFLSLVHFEGGLMVTPYHPIYGPNDRSGAKSSWHFPIDNPAGMPCKTKCSAVYSFVLGPALTKIKNDTIEKKSGRAQSMIINDIACITLAHGIECDDVATHPFYGTERVVESLQALDYFAWSQEGKVVLQEGCVVKDPASGLACGFSQFDKLN